MATPPDPPPIVPGASASASASPPGAAPPQPGHTGPPGYPPPYLYVPPPRTNGLAVASLVLGILWVYWIGSVLALVFGYAARRQIRERHESGDGMATAGIVLGWVGVGVLSAVVVIGVVAAGASS